MLESDLAKFNLTLDQAKNIALKFKNNVSKRKCYSLKKKLKNKRIAVTGSNGFIASHVVKIINEYNLTNKKILLLNKKNTDYSLESLKKKLNNIDFIIHLSSATGGIGYTSSFPASQFYIALKNDLNVFEASKDKKIKRLVSLANFMFIQKNKWITKKKNFF